MIIEWTINALITIIKLPLQLLELPQLDLQGLYSTASNYCTSISDFVVFFFDNFALTLLGIAISVMVLMPIVNIIGTIISFFKAKAG